MNPIRWIQGSHVRSSIVLALTYLGATLGGVLAVRNGVPYAVPIGLVATSLALLLTGIVVRAPGHPRWALIVSALVLAVGTPLVALATYDPAAWLNSANGTVGYGWFYLWVAGSTPVTGRGCHSPWVVVAGAVILVAATWVAVRF